MKRKTKKLINYSLVLVFFAFILNTITANALASNFTGPVDQLFWITVAGSVVVGGFVFGLGIYFIYKYRESSSAERKPVTNETKYEKIWLTFAIALVVILVLISTPLLYKIEAPTQTAGAIEIDITAHRFYWDVSIPTYNSTGIYYPGSPDNPVQLKVNTLYKLNITSADVDHSFFAYNLAIKVDAIPGQFNIRYFKIVDAGTYIVTCAEFCGVNHYDMQFTILAT